MSHGGMSPSGGLTPVDDVERGAEVSDGSRVRSSASASEPPPLVADADLGTGPRVVRADSSSVPRSEPCSTSTGRAAATPTPWSRRSRPAARTPPRTPPVRPDPTPRPRPRPSRAFSPGRDGRRTRHPRRRLRARLRPRDSRETTRPTGFEPPTRAVRGGVLADLERLPRHRTALRRVETQTTADGIRTRDATNPDDDPRRPPGPVSGSPGFDLRAAARWLEHTVPAAAVVVARPSRRDTHAGIVAFAWATAVLIRADTLLRAQVALRAERTTSGVAWCVVMVATALAALSRFAFGGSFWTNFVFAEKAPTASGSETTASASFTRIVWETAMADTVARYVTVGAKACCSSRRTRGRRNRETGTTRNRTKREGRQRGRGRGRGGGTRTRRATTRRPRYPPRRPRRRRR